MHQAVTGARHGVSVCRGWEEYIGCKSDRLLSLAQCFLYFKGYLAIQAYRISHYLWLQDRRTLAFTLQSKISQVFQSDIHPAAKLGYGLFLDHATGFVVGETCVVGNNVSILHNVTFGGSGRGRCVSEIAGGALERLLLMYACVGVGGGGFFCFCLKQVRHPRIGDGVLVGSGATILGPVNVGNQVRVGAKSVTATQLRFEIQACYVVYVS